MGQHDPITGNAVFPADSTENQPALKAHAAGTLQAWGKMKQWICDKGSG